MITKKTKKTPDIYQTLLYPLYTFKAQLLLIRELLILIPQFYLEDLV